MHPALDLMHPCSSPGHDCCLSGILASVFRFILLFSWVDCACMYQDRKNSLISVLWRQKDSHVLQRPRLLWG